MNINSQQRELKLLIDITVPQVCIGHSLWHPILETQYTSENLNWYMVELVLEISSYLLVASLDIGITKFCTILTPTLS